MWLWRCDEHCLVDVSIRFGAAVSFEPTYLQLRFQEVGWRAKQHLITIPVPSTAERDVVEMAQVLKAKASAGRKAGKE